jgi:polyisoprenoid-binding protein YceI
MLSSVSLAVASDYPAVGVFEVVKSESELRVLIYPAGLLGGLGHSHVISTNDIVGRIVIAEDPATSSVELAFPVETFEVDNDALREEEGDEFEKMVSDKDKRGTRKNMLGKKLLDSSKFSTITMRSEEWTRDLPDIVVKAEFTVRDQNNVLEFPASVAIKDDQIVVTGSLTLTHGQLGLKPFKAGLGSLRVRDEMELKFQITAWRLDD